MFKIFLKYPYKLCDFKPAYGYIFSDLIRDYEYWGHFDISDSFWGNIEKLLFPILDGKNEKIGFLGHLSVYKNTKEVNERIFLQSNSAQSLKNIFNSEKNFAFDENNSFSINTIYRDNGLPFKRIDELYLDISPRFYAFKNATWNNDLKFERFNEKFIIEWNNGELYKLTIHNDLIVRENVLYVHYQKRKIDIRIDINRCNRFLLVPNEIIEYIEIDNKNIRKFLKDRINIDFIKKRIKKFMNI